MTKFDGSLARSLDFGEIAPATAQAAICGGARAGLRLALPGGLLRGPAKYQVLDRRRRRAQIRARRVLDLLELTERTQEEK
jgi:hypothetical protein